MKRVPIILLFAVGLGIICAIVVYTERSKIPTTPLNVFFGSTTQNSSSDALLSANEAKNSATNVVRTSPAICHDLNLASMSDLQRVDGIGEKLSAAIIERRNALGRFTNRTQLLEISGIGQALAEALMTEFYIENEQTIITTSIVVSTGKQHTTVVHTTVSVSITSTTCTEIVDTGYFDINTVSREELLTIPDITEIQADAIISLRTQLGKIQNLRELALIPNFSSHFILNVLPQYLYITNDNGMP